MKLAEKIEGILFGKVAGEVSCISEIECLVKNLFSLVRVLQVASLDCTKEPGPEMLINDGIACALKVPCSKKQEFQQHIRWVAEDVGPNGKCPVQDENEFRKLDRSLLDESASFVSQSTISSISQDFGKVKPCC